MKNNFIKYCLLLMVLSVPLSFAVMKKDSVIDYDRQPVIISHLPAWSVLNFRSDDLFFPYSADFKPEGVKSLQVLNDLVKKLNKNLEVYVNAYSDDIPNVQDRKKLTDAQAEAVASYLWSVGLEYTRLQFKGFGSEKMLASSFYVSTNHFNRRVEVVFVPIVPAAQIYPFKESL